MSPAGTVGGIVVAHAKMRAYYRRRHPTTTD